MDVIFYSLESSENVTKLINFQELLAQHIFTVETTSHFNIPLPIVIFPYLFTVVYRASNGAHIGIINVRDYCCYNCSRQPGEPCF